MKIVTLQSYMIAKLMEKYKPFLQHVDPLATIMGSGKWSILVLEMVGLNSWKKEWYRVEKG